MSQLHKILDREAERVSAAPQALETVLDLKDRRDRRRRVEAIAVVAIICGALAAASLVGRFGAAPVSPDITYRHNGDIAVFQEMHIVRGNVEPRVVVVNPVSGRPTTLPIGKVGAGGSGRTTEPSWSPDGSSVAYLLANELWILNVSDGAERRVAECTSCSGSPAWSPDGSTLAMSSRENKISLFDVDTGQASTIWISPVQATFGSVQSPAWSPDGQSIAFILQSIDAATGNEVGELFTIRPDGSELRRIAGSDAWSGVAWSPDGATIAFLAQPGEESSECRNLSCPITLRLVEVANAAERSIAHAGECLCLTFTPGVAWSPDGTQLALVTPGSDRQHPPGLYTVSADGSRLHLLLPGGWGEPSWRAAP
jgi:sugar lactone lactonase YvrE